MADILMGEGVRAKTAPHPLAPSRLGALAAYAAMMLMLLAPALLNGFPLIFPDTGGYLDRPILGTLEMGRSAMYGAFLYPGIAFSFWPNIILQAAMMVWLIALTLRTHDLGGRPWLALGIVTLLTITTSMPWFAAQLMPDILFAAAALALHLLLFRDASLGRTERWGLVAVIIFAIPSHMAAAGMAVAIIAAVVLLTRFPKLSLPKPRLTVAAGAVAAGLVMCPVSNYAVTGNFALTPGGSSFLFGRLVEDGIVKRYLDEKCPDPTLRLCGHLVNFPNDTDWWLWDGSSPFRKLGDFSGSAEEKTIILETMKLYPVMHLKAAISAALQQLVRFGTEVSVEYNAPTIAMFKEHTPGIYPQFMKARQQAAPFDVAKPLNLVHIPVAALALAGLGLALLMRRRLGLPPEMAALAVTVLLALAANAAICGVFAHAVDRYQSRLVWLAVLASGMMAAWLYRQRFPDRGELTGRP